MRFTPEERSRLEAEAAGVPLGTFIRAKVLGEPLPSKLRRTGFALKDRAAFAKALALLGQSRLGLRQGVLRVLAHLRLDHLKKEWDKLYKMRSGVFHGTHHLTEPEMHELAQSAMTLCGQIVIAFLRQEGITIPSVASKHYPDNSDPEPLPFGENGGATGKRLCGEPATATKPGESPLVGR